MRGLHFLTTDGIEITGLIGAFEAHCAAAVALPGEFVGLAENLDQEASMRKLDRDQQLLVEFRRLRVRDVWVTIDHFGDAGVLWYEYEFEAIFRPAMACSAG